VSSLIEIRRNSSPGERNRLLLNRVYCGDARMLSPKLQDRSIAVTLTSPPYWRLKNYGVTGQLGWGQAYEQYMSDLLQVFGRIHSATTNTGSLWIVLDTLKQQGKITLLPFDLADRLQREIGWILQDVIIWDKGKTLPWSRKGQLRNQFEYVLCFSKKRRFKYEVDRLKQLDLKQWWVRFPERYNPRGKVPSNIWNLPIPVQGSWSSNGLRHACPFPTPLVERILLLTTDPGARSVVLDPFAGSGIVPALAEVMGRQFLAFELNPEFVRMYQTVVRPLIREEWKVRRTQLTTDAKKREILQRLITKLRLVKYPKALIGRLGREVADGNDKVLAAIALAGPIQETVRARVGSVKSLCSLAVTLLVRNTADVAAIRPAIQRVSSVPPLSKFGIDVVTTVTTIRKYRTNRSGRDGIKWVWIYQGGRTYRFRRRMRLSDWLTKLGRRAPGSRWPEIAANVKVQQRSPAE